ncbi:MAG: hypothetical protein AAF710_09885, partial [Planctomycetota bacterium]
DLDAAQDAYRFGRIETAAARIDAYTRDHGRDAHALIARLEQGHIRRTLGDLDASDAAFDAAHELVRRYDEAPDVSLSRETLAAFTNLNALPYRGTYVDRVLLYTYRALNALERGETDAARVELRRAYERQRLAVAENAERIEAATQTAAADGGGYDAARAMRDPRLRSGLDTQYATLNRFRGTFRGYADFANPLTEWLQGVYHLGDAADGSDLEWARKAFERTAGMTPGNPYLEADLAMAERIAAGGPDEPTVWVVLATGVAPRLESVRLDIPLFLFGGGVDYVGANFPYLVPHPVAPGPLTVTADGRSATTRPLADIDAMVAQRFERDLPAIVTKTLVAAGTKAAAAYALRETFDHRDDTVTALVRIFATVYQYAANQADLRTWATLPKRYEVARLPLPTTGKITLSMPGAPPTETTLGPGTYHVVVVRSVTPGTPGSFARVSQFSLGPPVSPEDLPAPVEPTRPQIVMESPR